LTLGAGWSSEQEVNPQINHKNWAVWHQADVRGGAEAAPLAISYDLSEGIPIPASPSCTKSQSDPRRPRDRIKLPQGATSERRSRRRCRFLSYAANLADCGFNLAALRPAYAIKHRRAYSEHRHHRAPEQLENTIDRTPLRIVRSPCQIGQVARTCNQFLLTTLRIAPSL
jgi:hypothetical protein